MNRLKVISKGRIIPLERISLNEIENWEGEKMETEVQNTVTTTKNDSFRTILYFMKWFLQKESLEQYSQLSKWMKALRGSEKEEASQWTAFVRLDLISSALPALRSILERPLTYAERLFLDATVERFIEESVKEGEPWES